MDIKLFSTAPHPKDEFWQFVVTPTVSVLRHKEQYTVCSIEWLFWSLTFLINDNKR